MKANHCTTMVLACLLCGCSTTYTIVEPSDSNPYAKPLFAKHIRDGKVQVCFLDDREADATMFQVGDDSCRWIDPNTGFPEAARTKDIRKVVTKNHFLGALEGLGIGLCGGISAGALLGRAIEGPPRGDLSGLGTVVAAVVGGVIGTVAGTVHGAASGHKYEYEFVWFSRKDSSGTGREEQLVKKREEQSR